MRLACWRARLAIADFPSAARTRNIASERLFRRDAETSTRGACAPLKWSVPNLPSGYGGDTRPVPKCRHENSTKETNMTKQFTTKVLFIVLVAVCWGAVLPTAFAQRAVQTRTRTQYQVSDLPGLGGTSNGGNSISDQTWVSGYARRLDRDRHAALWRNGVLSDLGTLGGPNSSVTWNVKNTAGIIVGISQTADPEPLGEAWSSAAFYSTPHNVGYINLGFVWQNNQMRGLPPF